MKKIIIGTLVGTIIYFGFQTFMWMGGFHQDFFTYAAEQDTILSVLSSKLPDEGMYMMPMANPKSPDFTKEQKLKEEVMLGNPWAMVFYHPKMEEFSSKYLIRGLLFVFVSTLIVAVVLHFGKFPNFTARFCISMAFAVFTMFMGVLDDLNWWTFPWSFILPQILDLLAGWGLCSIWLALYLKRKTVRNPQTLQSPVNNPVKQ